MRLIGSLSIASASCNVYDPSLTHRIDSSAIVAMAPPPPIAAVEPSLPVDFDAGGLADQHSCGDGVVDPGEHCDIAIEQGEVGACPDGCSGRDGCVEQRMIGRGCDAHCEAVEIERAIPNDGCCPRGASPAIDPDCSSTCGNGVIEPGEHCDPPETCVVAEACASTDVCMRSEYSGDPAHCTASCDVRPVESCVSGDGCCPPGCNAAHDSDCPHAAPPSIDPNACDGGCVPVDAGMADADCSSAHHGGACEACDCERCQDATLTCSGAGGSDGALCDAVVACAAQAHCTGLDCYCGAIQNASCAKLPLGPCVKPLRQAAGSDNVYEIITLGLLGSGTIGRALALLNCRMTSCASECSAAVNE
ncbi:MAG TPA: hypothetical protein VGI70_16475 [Polyangiales bacterium]